MTELIRSIPGPWFLALLWGVSCFAFFLHGRIVDAVNLPVPGAETHLTALELGYLARGKRGMIETALVMAEQERSVRIDPDTRRVHPIEDAKPSHIATKELLQDLSNSDGSLQGITMRSTEKAVRTNLEATGFLYQDAPLLRIAGGLLIYGPVCAVAIAKAQLGLHHGRPIGFLVISMLILGAAMLLKMFGSFANKGKATRKAKRILEQHRQLLQPVLKNSLSMQHRPDSAPTLAALFGLEQMKKTGWSDDFPIIGLALATAPLWMVGIPVYRNFLGGWFDRSSSSSGSGVSDSGCGGGSDSGCGGGGGGGDSGCGGGGGCGGCGGGGSD